MSTSQPAGTSSGRRRSGPPSWLVEYYASRKRRGPPKPPRQSKPQVEQAIPAPLPVRYWPEYKPYPRILDFGIGMTDEEFERYAERFCRETEVPQLRLVSALKPLQDYLLEKTGVWFALNSPVDYEYVLTFYTNYDLVRGKPPLSPEKEKAAVAFVQQEFGLVERPAEWHFDNNGPVFRRTPWSFEVRESIMPEIQASRNASSGSKNGNTEGHKSRDHE